MGMSIVADLKQALQDVVAPELRAHSAKLDALAGSHQQLRADVLASESRLQAGMIALEARLMATLTAMRADMRSDVTVATQLAIAEAENKRLRQTGSAQ